MDQILDQVWGVYEAGFPYAALMLTLAVPDICATLELPPEAKPKSEMKARYIRWYNANIAVRYDHLSAEECFSLRCGMLHQGRMGNDDAPFDRLFFSFGEIKMRGSVRIDDGPTEHLVGVSLPEFMGVMKASVEEWLQKKAGDRHVQKNLTRLVRQYGDGYPMGGIALSTGAPCIG